MATVTDMSALAAAIRAKRPEPVSRSPQAVKCPWCGAGPAQRCHTPSGARSDLHRWRLDAWRSRMRGEAFLVRIRKSDQRLGVRTGEVYVARTYWLDPGKCSLLARVPDSYDPECNQYWHTVEWLGFTRDVEDQP